jgi:hypothetical protein
MDPHRTRARSLLLLIVISLVAAAACSTSHAHEDDRAGQPAAGALAPSAPLDTAAIPATRLLAYTLTHDQVGNRAIGDRPSQNLTPGQLAVKAALVLGSPYTAMLFMGASGWPQCCYHDRARTSIFARYCAWARNL